MDLLNNNKNSWKFCILKLVAWENFHGLLKIVKVSPIYGMSIATII